MLLAECELQYQTFSTAQGIWWTRNVIYTQCWHPCQLLRDYRIPWFDTASTQVHEYSFSLYPSLLAAKSGERPIHDMSSARWCIKPVNTLSISFFKNDYWWWYNYSLQLTAIYNFEFHPKGCSIFEVRGGAVWEKNLDPPTPNNIFCHYSPTTYNIPS